MATVDNRIVQLEFKNAEFAKAMAATLEAIKALNEALKTVGADNGFENITADAADMKGKVGEAVKSSVAALPALAARAGQVAGRLGEAGARMASALLPIGRSAEDQTKKLEGLAAADFGKINDSARRVSLAPVGAAADKVAARFTALQVVAVTALSKITSKAIDTASALTKSLSFEQVGAGFEEYELKLGSIQTIMAGSGADLETVNGYLEELNTYADRTIYSFADMTQNIGKFTNAGVDLDTAVASIQGVAQVAAVSGANTNEASRAMYNFAQALSKGYVQLIDWKSIELANMGTVEFKQQLIDAAEAQGTLTKEGEGWVTEAGTYVTAQKGFNDSLTDAWLTTEVLTSTLSDYADETTNIGKKAFAAAQDVKTFTQLLDTVKEAIGSGFARSFEIIIGDFDEAKALFTDINDAISGFVDNSATARNELLQGWKDLGGRDKLIEALADAFKYLGEILAPIREAFREVFPPLTAERLYELTESLNEFIQKLRPSEQTVENVRRIFTGFFSAIKIGIEFFKALGRTIGDFLTSIGLGSGVFLEFVAGLADFVTEAREGMVSGEGIISFFESFSGAVKNAGETAKDAFSVIIDWAQKMWETLQNIWSKVTEFMREFGARLAEAIDPSAFSASGEVISLALLGAIAAAIGKFIKDFKADPESLFGGLKSGFIDVLTEVANTLEAIQTSLKAGSLLKIAGAIGILAVSLGLLAAIDAEALARATGAMAGLFAQLIASMAILKASIFVKGDALGAGLLGITTGMLLVSASILFLAFAMEKIGELDIDAIGKGLFGIASGLTILVLAINRINAGGGLIRAGLAMIPIAIGLRLMANAIRAMGSLDMDTIGKGLYGVASALTALVLAMGKLPPNMISAGIGMIFVATALNLIARAVAAMGALSMDEIGKGLYGIASALTILVLAIGRMPANMFVTAAGILVVALALNGIARAMEMFAGMSWDEIGKGLYTLAASLTLLGVAMKAMTSSVGGAAATLLVAVAVNILASALHKFAALGIGQLIKSMVALAAGLAIMGGAGALLAGVGPGLLIAGAALVLIGGAFALVGAGALAFAQALKILAEVGLGAIKVLVDAVKAFLKLLPEVAKALVETLVVFVEGLPALIGPIGEFLVQLLDMFIEVIPKVVETLLVLIQEVLVALEELIPRFIEFGLNMLLALLQGIRDNITEVTVLALEILTGFIEGLTQGLPDLISAVVEFFSTALIEIAGQLGETVPTLLVDVGIAFLNGFLKGLGEAWEKVITFIKDIPVKILNWIKSGFGIFSPSKKMHAIGLDVIVGFLKGITEAAIDLFEWFLNLPVEILSFFLDAATWLFSSGWDILTGLVEGVVEKSIEFFGWFADLYGKVIGYFAGAINWLWDAGIDVIQGLIDGIIGWASGLWDFLWDIPGLIGDFFVDAINWLFDAGKAVMQGLWDGMVYIWDKVTGWLSSLNPVNWFNDINLKKRHAHTNLLPTGKIVMEGLQRGMMFGWKQNQEWLKSLNPAEELDDNAIARTFDEMAKRIASEMEGMDLNPTITPVIDLTEVERGFDRVRALTPEISSVSAGVISDALSNSLDDESSAASTGGNTLIFNQTNNSPEALSTTDIYRDTRNLVTLAKDELEIP